MIVMLHVAAYVMFVGNPFLMLMNTVPSKTLALPSFSMNRV
jgi:hypothetical protein